ncbi:hypothetical protein KZZ52_32990 [Dactylosporangium sp. AC04546]|uniref:hypothetical protein n=1 Tax=Dactylosporangium sp. AC04546 TaxID=2862460 RepID=UPI001EE12980|nr:hypothetical protein [Dactylosporangium sp. AC04546]WVK89891.1 hypothetical protein KZZ52_32990 [Dactylosporangium sp. AC04546]
MIGRLGDDPTAPRFERAERRCQGPHDLGPERQQLGLGVLGHVARVVVQPADQPRKIARHKGAVFGTMPAPRQ